MSETNFKTRFELLTGNAPFPWQIDLFENWFALGKFPDSCNLPTGLGKTSVIAIWLLALMDHPDKMPRRLVYVVNRRTVVDQTTDEVVRIRENLTTKLKQRPDHVRELKISTLRGQFADNREWSTDPSLPAVICSTVDMIGSRLLFSGYGVGFKTKPLHAGFLGQDVLVVHDEAHLEPAFQALLGAIEKEQWEGERSECMPWPKLRVMELTATSRQNGDNAEKKKRFGLTAEEKKPPAVIPNPPCEPIHFVWRRLTAKKTLTLHHVGAEKGAVAKRIAALAAGYKDNENTLLIFVRTLDDVEDVQKQLEKTKREIILLTGTIRGKERDELLNKTSFKRFLKDSAPGETVYLICTSAGEVGIDISADHMVSDLSPYDSMAQRFGRVNRYGDGDATIDVVYSTTFDEKDRLTPACKKTLELLNLLSPSQEREGEPATRSRDASPRALGDLRERTDLPFRFEQALTPIPTILPATDILFDAWAMTTIRGRLPGRPAVEPYLHGIAEWEPPQTYVAWRQEVWELRREFTDEQDRKDFERFATDLLEDYPLKSHELLRDSTFRKNSGIRDKLARLAAIHPDFPVWIQEANGAVLATVISKLGDLPLASRTVILPPEAGGLKIANGRSAGLFDGSDYIPEHRDAYDVADLWEDDSGPLRRRVWQGDDSPVGMTLEREIRFEDTDDEDAGPTKIWRWYVRKPEAANERGSQACELDLHLNDVKAGAIQMAGRLFDAHSEMAKGLILAAWCHDLGKHRERWQRSLGSDDYPDKVYAKSGRRPDAKPLRPRDFLRDHYRHEFGSVLDLCDANHPRHPKLMELSPGMQDLVIHLIAAHHGRARPHFPEEEAFDPDPNRDGQAVTRLAIETPQRFARLQRRYGRWGLAYIESLVRAADYFGSANPGESANQADDKQDQL